MDELNLYLQRYSDNGDSTLGLFFFENEFNCYCLEDEFRAVKIKGETRIPAGRYELKLNKNLTPLTKKYRADRRFKDWFVWHIQIVDVENFKNVYIHVGNDEADTDACILLGDTTNNNQFIKGMIGNSAKAFERFYKLTTHVLEEGSSKVFLNIRDEKKLRLFKTYIEKGFIK